MSLAERRTSERLIEAMGPMAQDENKIQRVILFIQSLRSNDEETPVMSFEEFEQSVPLGVAFNRLRDNVKQSYSI